MTARKKENAHPANKGDPAKKRPRVRPAKETAEAEPTPSSGFPVVGIGASAGGLDAFKRFFSVMPADSGMAFVLIQHLDPTHESLTADLLARHTGMPAVQIEDRMAVEPNHLYVIPPNRDLTIQKGVLSLTEPTSRRGFRLPIDFFFRSLAEDRQGKAIGIILSGSGTDGTLGVKAIKGAGGMTMAQSPETAQFDAMPRSAIETGLVDYVLAIEEMPAILIDFLKAKTLGERVVDHLPFILALLRARSKYDFRCYKKGTLTRRIERRMGLNHVDRVSDYLELLRANQHEVDALFHDMLIGVTGFFREPEAYKVLEREVIPKLVREKGDDASIRVWVPGCATGEEPYSIAILLLEELHALQKHCNLQIFASDIDDQALAVARGGVYPQNIAVDLSPERLRSFFREEGSTYQVAKSVRDSMVFAVQNLIGDPPFSRLDLISCRNLLIYLEPDVQRKILSLFHFVLNDSGFLFLGGSETIGQQDDLFAPVSKKWRIYRRLGPTRRDRVEFPVSSGEAFAGRAAGVHAAAVEPSNLVKIAQQALLARYAPFSVLISRKYEVLYVYGSSGPYLELTTGEPTQDLLTMTRDGLRTALRTAVHKAIKDNREASVHARMQRDSGLSLVRVTVLPVLAPKAGEGLLVASFADEPERTPLSPAEIPVRSDDELMHQLEADLKTTREELQGTIEELETSNEELKTSNEEIMSMNEELQSTNEELETSKEELQSLNEELTTVNNQLQDKVEELSATNDDLGNLLSSTELATLFLDRRFRIKRFTPAARKLFSLIPSDVGRPLSDIAHRLGDSTLLEDAEAVLASLVPTRKDVRDLDGRWYSQGVLPYRTEDNRIEGVVATFTDISVARESAEALRRTKNWLQSLLESSSEGIYGVDQTGRCSFANPALTQLTGYDTGELLGKRLHELIHHTKSDGSPFPWEECFVHRCLTEGIGHPGNHDLCWRKDGTSFPASFTANPIVEEGRVTGAVVICRDITETVNQSQRLDHMASHDPLTGLFNRRAFEERLEQAIESARLDRSEHVLCYLDLDRFKMINDACGHAAGDELLRELAGALRLQIRKHDTLARLGGDEFAVLMEQCDLEQAQRVGNNLQKAIADFRFQWEDQAYMVGASLGLVSITADTGTRSDALRAADAACYAAKADGGNRFHVYSGSDTGFIQQRAEMRWAMCIQRAIDEGRLYLGFQPIVPLESGSHASYGELLLRMEDEDGHMVSANEFFGAAERFGFGPRLDRWVIEQAFQWLSACPEELNGLAWCGINLSGDSLGKDGEFLDFVLAQFDRTGLAPEKICFEITESAAIANLASANHFIHTLKKRGCRFALDDFGCGMASFNYLKALPVDFIKIAGVFVKELSRNPVNLAMVKSIHEIGHAMGKQTIAEWVENESDREALQRLGIDFAQGYVTGRPRLLGREGSDSA